MGSDKPEGKKQRSGKMEKTKWNERLSEYAGMKIRCSEFDPAGLETDFYIVGDDGSLSFGNELRGLPVSARKWDFKNYWNPSEKGRFIEACQKKTR